MGARDGGGRRQGSAFRRERAVYFLAHGVETPETLLDDAAKSYGTAQDARDVRRDLQQRDRLMAELPYYRRPAGRSQFAEEDDVKLWKAVRELNVLVELTPKQRHAAALLAGVGRASASSSSSYDDLPKVQQPALTTAAKKWATSQNPDAWHEIEDVLQVPFLPVEDRMNLLRASQLIAVTLEQRTRQGSHRLAEHREATGREGSSGRPQHRSLALAVLGENWPDFKDTQIAVTQPEEGGLASVAAAGRQAVRRGAAELAGESRVSHHRGRGRPAAGGGRETSRGRPPGPATERLPRRHHASEGGPRRRPAQAANARLAVPAGRPHAVRLLEHGADGGTGPGTPLLPGGRPGLPARCQGPRGESREEAGPGAETAPAKVDEERARLEAAKPPVMEYSESRKADTFKPGPVKLYPTDEPAIWLTYRLKTTGTPTPQPVRWVKYGPGMKEPEEFPVRSAARDSPRDSLASDSQHAEETGRAQALGGELLPRPSLRGRDDPLRPARAERDDFAFPPPEGGAGGRPHPARTLRSLCRTARTAISLVLDCSGSMKEKKDGRTRWDKATRPLQEVLEGLPAGVTVSPPRLRGEGILQQGATPRPTSRNSGASSSSGKLAQMGPEPSSLPDKQGEKPHSRIWHAADPQHLHGLEGLRY